MTDRHPNQRALSSLPVELRRTSVPPNVRAWVEREAGSTIVRVRRLPGASTSAVHQLTLVNGAQLVVRRYAWGGFLDAEPDAPQREVDALQHARRHGLPAPEVIADDTRGTEVGDGVPVVLMRHLPGRPLASPDPNRLVEAAASIHAVSDDPLGHEYVRWYEDAMISPPALTPRPDLWEQAIELWHDGMPSYQPTLIHRDFHPGNLLWTRGRLTGIVDWANACRGPVGCDVAHCRANLRDLAGEDAAASFVAAHEALTGEVLHPYWIVAAHLEHDQAHWTAERLADDEPDLAAALLALG